MSVSISGILLDPFGQPASFAEVKFITWQGANDVLTTAPAVFKTSADGAYSFAVEFGTFTVQVRYNQSNGKFQTIKQKVVVNSNVTATTLGELLLFNEPLTPPEIAYVEQLVAEAEGYKDDAAASAAASEASSQSSATSAAASAQSATDAANSAALIAPVPLNGGVWASGQTYDFYNQYMIYNGEAYSPLPETVLPYTVGTAPDLGFVYQIKLNDHSLLANRNAAGAHSPTATGTTASRSLEDRFADVLNASDYIGLQPGVVDISVYKVALQDSEISGKPLSFPAGVYDFGGQNIFNGGLLPGQDAGQLNIVGVFGSTVFENIASAHYSGVLRSRHVIYKNCQQPIYATGNITDLDICWNEFEGCRRSVYHNDDTAMVRISKGIIEKNYIHDHIEDDFVGAVLLNKAPFVDDVVAQYNIIENVQADSAGVNIFTGIMIGSDNHPVSNFNRNKVNHNTLVECGNKRATFAAPSFGSVVVGRDSEQVGNVVRDGGWLEPLYMKGNGNTQRDNKCHDNQHSGVSMKIMLDTNASKENVQDGNVVTGQCDIRAAVRMFGSGRSLNSQVDITTTAQVEVQGGLAYQCTRSTTVDGKLTVTGQFKAPKGIQITTAGDVEVDVTLTSQDTGVTVLKSTDGNLGTVTLKGKVTSEGQAVNVNWCERYDGQGLEIICDRNDGDQIFIYAQQSAIFDGGSLRITDAQSDGLTLVQPISLFAKDGGDLASNTISMSDFNIVTERNLTSVVRYNADAGLLAPNEGKLNMSNMEVDLNGKTCTNLISTLSDMKRASLSAVNVDGVLSRTISGGGKTINELLINQNLMDYVATDDVAGHTNAAVTKSRVESNKIA